MSQDYCATCHKCRKTRHLGQVMANTPSFGFGSKDQEGANAAAAWLFWHVTNCGAVVQVHNTEDRVDGHGYEYVHDEAPPEEV